MGRKKVILSTDELRPEMIIAEEIKANGLLLVNEGIELNDSLIGKLRELYFYGRVTVYIDEADIEQEMISEFYRNKTVEEIEESFSELSSEVKDVFISAEGTMQIDIEEIRSFTEKIQQELHSTRSVIKNIILLGSGEDVIYRHSVNVTALSSILGKWLGFSAADISLLTYAAILHDFGKTKIDTEILNKILPLTEEEWIKIQKHPILAYNALKGMHDLDVSVLYGVLMHHERLDGSGYPLRIREDKIHPFAKIIAIADTFDAVNSDRVYRQRQSPFAALETLQRESLEKLDYKYCKVFIEHVLNFLMGESVLLNTNKICTVIGVKVNEITSPLLFDGVDFIDLNKEKELYIKKLML